MGMKTRHRVALLMLLWWVVGMVCSTIMGDWPVIANIAFVVIGVAGSFLWLVG